MRKRCIVLILSIVMILILSACGGEEKEKVEQAKQDFQILYDYDESKIMPVVEEEKTPEELAEDYLEERIGLEEDEEPSFAERGVEDEQGVFLESAIYEGSKIPNVTAMDDETKERFNNDRDDRSIEKKEEEYEELKKDREDILDEQYKEDNKDSEYVEDEIKKDIEKYEQDKEEEEKEQEGGENNNNVENGENEGFDENDGGDSRDTGNDNNDDTMENELFKDEN